MIEALRLLWAWLVTPQNDSGLTFKTWRQMVDSHKPTRPLDELEARRLWADNELPAVAAGRMRRPDDLS